MIFLADESVDRQIIERLRQDGQRVFDVAELISSIINRHTKEIKQAFSVITAASVRIRKFNL
jgi:hypothetical protein